MFKQSDVQRFTKKSSQFQAVKYVQAKTMCRDAQKIKPVSSCKVCSSKNDVQPCNKKSSQFQAVKYVQAKTMCRDATKNLVSFKQ